MRFVQFIITGSSGLSCLRSDRKVGEELLSAGKIIRVEVADNFEDLLTKLVTTIDDVDGCMQWSHAVLVGSKMGVPDLGRMTTVGALDGLLVVRHVESEQMIQQMTDGTDLVKPIAVSHQALGSCNLFLPHFYI